MLAVVGFMIFLAFQVASVVWYGLWLRSQYRNLDRVEEPTPVALEPARGQPEPEDWIGWVRRHFPAGVKKHGNFARDDAFQELNWRLSTSLPLAILHRLGVVAPLLGVMITAWGFWALEFPTLETAGAVELVGAIRPVVIGIFVGGFLSILNQCFLGVAEWLSDRFRERARRWFDDMVWPNVVTREESTNRRVAEVFGRATDELVGFARKHTFGAEAVVDSARVVERAADVIRSAVAAVSTEWRSSVATLATLGKSIEQATVQFRALIPDGERLSNRMVNSVERFDQIIGSRFEERVRLQEEASRKLSESAKTMADVVGNIAKGTGDLMGHCELQKKAAEGFLDTFQKAVVPNQERMVKTSASLNATVRDLSMRLKQLEDAASAAAVGLAASAPELRRVFGLVEKSMEQFLAVVTGDLASASKRHLKTVGDWSKTALSTEVAVKSLGDSSASLGLLVDEVRQVCEALRKSVEGKLGEANDRLLAVASSLATSTSRFAVDLNGSLEQTAGAFNNLTDRASTTLDRIGPPIERFHTLVIDQLGPAVDKQRAAAESASGSLDRFSKSADRLKTASEILRELAENSGRVHKLLAEELPTLESAIRDATRGLQNAADGLGGIVSTFNARLDDQKERFEGGLDRVGQTLEKLSAEVGTLSARVEEGPQRNGRGWLGRPGPK